MTAIVLKALEDAVDNGWITEEEITEEALVGFLSGFGRKFYKLPANSDSKTRIRLEKKGEKIPSLLASENGTVEIVPWGRGKEIRTLTWVTRRCRCHLKM